MTSLFNPRPATYQGKRLLNHPKLRNPCVFCEDDDEIMFHLAFEDGTYRTVMIDARDTTVGYFTTQLDWTLDQLSEHVKRPGRTFGLSQNSEEVNLVLRREDQTPLVLKCQSADVQECLGLVQTHVLREQLLARTKALMHERLQAIKKQVRGLFHE